MHARGDASILHADLDAFYASVEQRDDRRLRGRPVLVGGGVVLAASYEAKARGVKTAMNERQALRLCPDAIVVSPRFEAYTEASRRVFEVFDDTTPLVEGLSIDEAFLDVGGLHRIAGAPEHIAAELRREVRDRVGLPITVGVARTKFLAKVASGVGKPDGLLVVAPDGETEFLHPLPVERLWGVGPKTAAKLEQRGLRTVGDIADVSEEALTAMLGVASGRHLHALAHHRDPRPVEVGRRRKSVGSQQALGRSPKSPDDLVAILHSIVDRVMRRLRAGKRVGRTVTLRLRFDDFTRVTRSSTLDWPTDATEPVLDVARELLEAELPRIADDGLTLLGMAIANLTDASAVQLALPLDHDSEIVAPRHNDSTVELARSASLDATLDTLRDRFGSAAVTRASSLGRTPGIEVPKLPDHAPSETE
ncbi:MAG: DNA polymerase IV [Actinomycetota bacterium]